MTSWVSKLKIECSDQEDGSLLIQIEWDENDPELAEWTSWGQEGQQEFIWSALNAACIKALGEELDTAE
jgi:hypothetical protein